MEQKALAKWLKLVLLGTGLCGLAVYLGIIPGYGLSLRSLYPEFSDRFWPWLIPLAVLAIIALGFFRRDPSVAVHSVLVWTFVNAVSAAVGAIAALAHPLAVLAAALAAPITSLNPAIAAGWVAGLVQVWIRPPAVRDFETLPADLETFRTFFRNPVVRVLLVVALANLGSALGTWIALPWIAALCAS